VAGVPNRQSVTSARLADKTVVKVLSRPHLMDGRPLMVRVALSQERQEHELGELLLGLLLALPVAVAIAAIGGHWLAGRALGPLDRMARRAQRLTADTLGERLPVENPDDELGQLAGVFNLALARIEQSFGQLRRFTADASHELRTPLTAIRTVGEVALQEPQRAERYREAIGSMLEEVDRLSRLVESLLLLSRADAGPALHRQELRLFDLVKDAAALLEVLADEKGQRVEVHGEAEVKVEVDGLILRQALINLIDNAIKYTPRDGRVTVEVRAARSVDSPGKEMRDGVELMVGDTGEGIPAADISRLTERFYRVDRARSRELGGTGLGLAIVKHIVQLHRGALRIDSRLREGTTVSVWLPAAHAAAVASREA
jgi:heavy metal sensor kinase